MIGHEVGVPGHALVHLVADDVHQPLKHLLHVDVVFGAGLEELEPWRGGKEGKRERGEGGKRAMRERERHKGMGGGEGEREGCGGTEKERGMGEQERETEGGRERRVEEACCKINQN